MIRIVETAVRRRLSLDSYAADAKFTNAVASLRAEVAAIKPKLDGRTIWMVNSTATGGGVAEMLPRLCFLMRELGLSVKWAVIDTDRQEFFRLTKRLHNMIHDDAGGGLALGAEEARLYEAVSRENADSLKPHLRADDILVVHDPQPLPMGQMLRDEVGLRVVWRCHIGLDERTEATRAAWRFLRPYLEGYDRVVFSMPEYVPGFLKDRSFIITPAIDPISHKNRDLLVDKLTGVLCNSGLQAAHEPVPSEDYANRVERLTPDGGVAVPGEIGLLFRPIVLQVSRWDRLKGWAPLLEGFVRMKDRHRSGGAAALSGRRARRVSLARLVLAGPDPSSVADDPEGLEVFGQIRDRYRALDPEIQEDVIVLKLPMQSRKQNALIVNALQRCATVLVQNSLREGFGLTATEGMWKHLPILGSAACGIRQQVRDGIDGLITQAPGDPDEIASHMRDLLIDPLRRYRMGQSAQLRVYEKYLIFRQIARYAELFARLV
jgi:trehalose synthase